MSEAPTHRPRAVIFDMDGLMLDTEPLAARAWTEAACNVGLAFDHAVTGRLIGRTFADCRALIADHHGADYPVDTLMEAWHCAYDAIVEREGIVLKPGLIELLDWLESQRIPKAVATSTRRLRARAKLEQTGLFGRFAALVGGDEISKGKPAPDIFLVAAERLACEPAKCLVLEDSEPGMIAAAAAGIPAIMVPDINAAPAQIAGRAPLVLRSLLDVHEHLQRLDVDATLRVR